MNKLSKKFATLFLGLVTAIGVGLVGADVDKKGVRAAEYVAVMTKASGQYTSNIPNGVLVVGSATNNIALSNTGPASIEFVFASNGTTASIFNNGSNEIRLYATSNSSNGGQLTARISEGHIITGFDFTWSKNGNGTFWTNGNSNGTWAQTSTGTGTVTVNDLSMSEVGFAARSTSSSGQVRITNITLRYTEDGPAESQPIADFLTAVGKIPGTVVLTDTCRDLIIAAELAYSLLEGDDLNRVTTEYADEVTAMQNARTTYDNLVAANAVNVADDFIARVEAIHTRGATVGDKDTIAALEIEYQGLLEVAAVATILNGTDVATKLTTIRNQLDAAIIAADEAAADAVIDLINALPAVGDLVLEDIAQVNEADAAFKALTEEQQGLIDSELQEKLAAAVNKIKEFVPETGNISYTVGGSSDSGATSYTQGNWTSSINGKSSTQIYLSTTNHYLMNETLFIDEVSGNHHLISDDSISFGFYLGSYGGAVNANLRVDLIDSNKEVIAYGSQVYTWGSADSTAKLQTPPINVSLNGVDVSKIVGIKIHLESISGNRLRLASFSASYNYFEVVQQEDVDVTDVTMTPKTMNLEVGETDNLIVNVAPANATNKDYELVSNAPSVATVAQDGTVTAVGVGTATITATTADGGFTDTCVVTVTEAATLKHEITSGFPAGEAFDVDFAGVGFVVATTNGIASSGTTGAYGAQIGKSDSTGTITFATKLVFDADEFEGITIAASKSTAGGTAKMKVMIGSLQVGSEVTLTQTSTEYRFEGAAQPAGMKMAAGDNVGHLTVIVEVDATGFQMKEIAIYGAATQLGAAQSGDLLDLIDLMNSADTCEDFDLAPDLRLMYDALTTEEKELFDLQTYTAAGGIEDTLLNKLVYMELLNDTEAETGGSPILEALSDTNTLIIMIIAILGLSALVGYYFIEKKRLAA